MHNARAVTFRGAGGVEVIALDERVVPDPGPGEVLVAVHAAGLNRADILQRRGFYPAPAGVADDIPGLEYAGTVAALGPGVRAAAVGDEVMGIVAGGAMATHLVVHERELIPVPAGVSLTHAAAIPEVFLTAYDALVVQSGLELGTTVLIHSVGSGVGTAALQLVNAAGGRSIGTSRTQSKLERASELGLHHGVLAEHKTFADAVLGLTGGQGAGIILDCVGAAYLDENLRAVAERGRIIVIGLLGGASGSASLGMLLHKRASITGTVLRARPLEQKAALAQRFAAAVNPLLSAGKLAPVVDATMPMHDIARAHELLESNRTFGKIVLCW